MHEADGISPQEQRETTFYRIRQLIYGDRTLSTRQQIALVELIENNYNWHVKYQRRNLCQHN